MNILGFGTMKVRNKKTSKVVRIRKNATTMKSVLRKLSKEGSELGTGDLARLLKKDPASILGACKRLRRMKIIDGYIGSGNTVYYHKKYGILTRKRVESLVRECEKQGYTDSEIEKMVSKLFEEADYWGSPPEWKWLLSLDWDVITT